MKLRGDPGVNPKKSKDANSVAREINRRRHILKAANSYNTSRHVQWAVLSPIVIWLKCTQALLSSLSEDPISVRLSPFLWDARLSSKLTVSSLSRSVHTQAFSLWISDRKQLPPQHPVSALTGPSQWDRVPGGPNIGYITTLESDCWFSLDIKSTRDTCTWLQQETSVVPNQ